jgi:hypothetical protein
MKKYVKVLFLALSLSAFTAAKSSAQSIYIGVRPTEPARVERPPAPSRDHVWVEGEWEVRDGRYAYKPGYWILPPRPHARWIRGHWRHYPHGWGWVPGHWR